LSFQSRAVAVGHDEDPLPSVRRSDVVSTHHERPAGVTARLQVFEHPVSAESAEPRHVLSHDPSGSHFSHQPVKLRPEPTGVIASCALTGDRDGLAGESSNESVSCREFRSPHVSHVAESRHVGPVAGEDGSTELIVLYLRDARPARAL
jgi:hypothetical protein